MGKEEERKGGKSGCRGGKDEKMGSTRKGRYRRCLGAKGVPHQSLVCSLKTSASPGCFIYDMG